MNMFLSYIPACPTGTYNAVGDLPSGPDTVCDSILCSENHRVEDHECIGMLSGLIQCCWR